MTSHSLRKVIVGWGTLLTATAAMLAIASTAFAVQTNQYDAFTACPTDAPAINEPTAKVAFCGASVAHEGVLKIGGLTLPLSQFGVQFAAIGLGLEEPECPQPGFCFGRAPGTTTVDSPPSVIRVGSPGKGPTGKGTKGKGVRLKVTIESAGDVRAVSLGFLFEAPLPVYKLPIKLHLEAPWLGRKCYVGSDKEPIFLTPFATGPPESFSLVGDPNGFKTEVMTITGLPMVDKTIAVPAGKGCGHSYHSHRHVDRYVNRLLGLPSPSGANEMGFSNSDIAFAAGAFEGVPPDGGAELQAAFDAAK